MKILVLSQYWWPENGVPQRRWAWLGGILAEAGHEVTVLAPPPHYQRKISIGEWWKSRRSRRNDDCPLSAGPAGEQIVRTGFFPAGPSLTQRIFNQAVVASSTLWTIVRRRGPLEGYKPDLVIGTVPALPTAPVTFVAAKLLKAPYVIDLRDAWPDLLQESANWNKATGRRSLRERVLQRGPLQLLVAVTRRAISVSLRCAAGIMVTSSSLEGDLRERCSARKLRDMPKVSTVRNVFPSATEFSKTHEELPENGTLNVLYAGTLGRAQNLSNAIEASILAKERGIEVAICFVGAGVTKTAMQESTKGAGIDVSFEPQHDAADLSRFYDWADTALVHLTDWEPLNRAVPSKTYELMSSGIHISGVVSGGAADLISGLGAGSVVPPECPAALAELWVSLATDRSQLVVDKRARQWVEEERRKVAPGRLLAMMEAAVK